VFETNITSIANLEVENPPRIEISSCQRDIYS